MRIYRFWVKCHKCHSDNSQVVRGEPNWDMKCSTCNEKLLGQEDSKARFIVSKPRERHLHVVN